MKLLISVLSLAPMLAYADSFEFDSSSNIGQSLAFDSATFYSLESGSQLLSLSDATTPTSGTICSSRVPTDADCNGDMRLVFNTPVNNLIFESYFYDFGDNVTVFVESAGVTIDTLNVEANAIIDLSSLANVTSVTFSGFNASMGLAWGNFSFDSANKPLDSDVDGVIDPMDNCILVGNPDQQDSDLDGYGNICDADVNNDCVINFLDVAAFSQEFLGTNPVFDFDNNGAVNFLDFTIMVAQSFGTPGPGLGSGSCLQQ